MDAQNKNGVMVCVTGQRSCERLIMHGAARCDEADGERRPMHVVHCAQTGHNFMNTPNEADAIEYLFTCAQVAGAQLSILRADDVESALAEYAKANNVGTIVLGASPDHTAYMSNASPSLTVGEGRKAQTESVSIRLQKRLPEVEFDIVR